MKRILLLSALCFSTQVFSATDSCSLLPDHRSLTQALKKVVKPTSGEVNGGFELNMWGTIVARDGTVCAVTMTGKDKGEQWPGSRVISAQKANTANAFSLPSLSLATANLYKATQPGGSLFGLQLSNPVNVEVAYTGKAKQWGTVKDAMVGKRIGGVNVFGGGLALYDKKGILLGAIGVSGDSSCADHNIAWKARSALKLDYVPAGVSATGDDNINYDQSNAFSHVECGNSEVAIAEKLPMQFPVSKK